MLSYRAIFLLPDCAKKICRTSIFKPNEISVDLTEKLLENKNAGDIA